MAQEEQILSSGNNIGSASVSTGFSAVKSRKSMQKKVPQRGLGVAQLEKIIVEEQWKGEALQSAHALANNFAADHGPSLTIISPNVSILSPLATNLCRSQFHVMNHEKGLQSPFSNDPHRLGKSQVNLQIVPERSGQLQRNSSRVNVSVAPVMPLSPAICSQIEPPSNQILHVNLSAQWLDEDTKIASMKKRSFSYVHEHCSDPNIYLNARKPRLDEFSPSCSRTRRLIPQQETAHISDGTRDFLILAPPATAFQDPTSKQKKPIAMNVDLAHLKSLSNQENAESRKELPFEFFPLSPGALASSNGEMMDLNLKL